MVRLPIELSYGCNQEPCGYVNRDSGATHTQNSAGGPFASVRAGKRQFLDRFIEDQGGGDNTSQSPRSKCSGLEATGNTAESSLVTNGTNIPPLRDT